MLAFLGSKLGIYLILFLILSGIVGGSYLWYQNTQATIEALKANVTKLETAVEIQNQTISDITEKAEANSRNAAELSSKLNQIDTRAKSLEKKLKQAELKQAIKQDPVKAQDDLNKRFEELSAALIALSKGLLDNSIEQPKETK